MSNNISHFYIKEPFDSSHDVTWSFQYNLSGSNKTDGGFTTFLKLSSQIPEVATGGGGESLGIGPKGVINKIENVLFCIGIDSTGLFGTKATFPTGLNSPIKDSMIIRLYNDLVYLTAFPLSSVGLAGLNLNNIYNTIRINYTNLGETFNIAKLNPITNEYDTFFSFTTKFFKKLNDPVQIGFSHTSPILPTNIKSTLTLKDIHAQGRYVSPKYDNLFEKIYDKDGNLLYLLNANGDILDFNIDYDELLKEEIEAVQEPEVYDEVGYLKISPTFEDLLMSKQSVLDGSLLVYSTKSTNVIDILIQPQSKVILNNSTATLKVVAVSNKKLLYQWYANGVKLVGQITDTCTIKNVTSKKEVYCILSTPDNDFATTENAIINIASRPVILTQPESKTVKQNSNANISIKVKEDDALIYDWYIDNTLVQNYSSNILKLYNITSDANVYCIVKNSIGFIKSNTIKIKVAIAPLIAIQPISVISAPKETANFNISAIGSEPLNYKWYSNNVPILENNLSSFSFYVDDSESSKQNKIIFCEVSNIAGSVTSNKVEFSSFTSPRILTQPSNYVITSGSNATFSVSATGYGVIRYQWYLNGVKINGATLSSYQVQSVTQNTAVFCILEDNLKIPVQTNNALVLIEQLPEITVQPTSIYVPVNTNATFNIQANSLTPIYYRWYVNSIEIPNSNSNTYTITNVVNTNTIYCKLSNIAGETTSLTVSALTAIGPTVTLQPSSVDIDFNTNAVFNINATGTEPLSYQWYSENTLLIDKNQKSLTISNLTYDIDNIYCTVSNLVTTVTSNIVYAHVFLPPYIIGQTSDISATSGTSITASISAQGGIPLSYQWYSGNNLILGATLSSYIIGSLTQTTQLSCIVTNRLGSANSNVITITKI